MRHADFTDKLFAERLVQPALMELTEHQRETLWLYSLMDIPCGRSAQNGERVGIHCKAAILLQG